MQRRFKRIKRLGLNQRGGHIGKGADVVGEPITIVRQKLSQCGEHIIYLLQRLRKPGI